MELYDLEKNLTENVCWLAERKGIDHYDLIVNIQTSKGAMGHYAKNLWNDQGSGKHEIALNPEYFSEPLEIVDTIMHELVHVYCDQNGIKETSRQGNYHNKKFKGIAESWGLKCVNGKNGWNTTTEDNTANLTEINESLPHPIRKTMIRKTIGKKSSTRSNSIKYTCPVCGASCRATKKLHLICGDCDEQMEAEE